MPAAMASSRRYDEATAEVEVFILSNIPNKSIYITKRFTRRLDYNKNDAAMSAATGWLRRHHWWGVNSDDASGGTICTNDLPVKKLRNDQWKSKFRIPSMKAPQTAVFKELDCNESFGNG